MHIGKNSCQSLHRVSLSEIPLEKEAKYLADWISGDESILFQKRLDSAKFLKSEVSAMAYELGFSYHLYEVAVKLFDSMFLGAIMTNMVTWHNFNKKWVTMFERIEKQYFRRILKCHPKAPSLAIYLEFGIVPFRFLLHKKRVAYYRLLKNRHENELTKHILQCQIDLPSKGDFYSQV